MTASAAVSHQPTKPDTNLNISAFRLLYLFRLLSQRQELSLKDLNNLLLEHEWIGKLYTPETIRKYFYTLQRIGADIETKSRGDASRYQLAKTPFTVASNEAELHSTLTILKIMMANPMKSQYKTLLEFLNWMQIYQLGNHETNTVYTALTSLESTLAKYEKLCFEGNLLEITTTLPQLKKLKFYPSAIEFQEQKNYNSLNQNFVLCGYTPESMHRLYIPFHVIESCRQISKASVSEVEFTTVVFKLTGRLVKNYRPYAGETILDKGDYLLVKHKAESVLPLLWRLMRYGEHCEIISPDSARTEVKKLIGSRIEALEFALTDNDLKVVDKLLKI